MRAVGSGRYGLATLACVLCSLTAATPRTAPAQAIAEQAVSAAAVPNAAAPTTHPAHQRITSRQAFDAEEAMEAYLATLDEETRTRSKEYTEGGYWLGIISLFYGLAVAFFLLNTGLSARMRDIAERISGRKPLQTALYGVQYILVTTLLLLPLSAYSGFIREHRYGFSTQSVGGYISDRFIGLAISLVLVSILLVLLYGATVPADEVYRYEASKRTTKISANVSGFLGTTRISLNDNLLDRGTDEEIEAVMAHEIGHFALNAAGEIFVFFGIVLIVGFAFVRWGFDRALARWGSGWGVRDVGDVAGLPLFLVLFSLYSAAITPITNGFIRSNEVEADIYGLNAAREPDGFSTIILKLGEYRKVDPGPLEEWLFYDHPSARNRILMAMRWKAEQPEYRRD
jgi:STE24 endopeptidase